MFQNEVDWNDNASARPPIRCMVNSNLKGHVLHNTSNNKLILKIKKLKFQ